MGLIRLNGHIDVPENRIDDVTAALPEHISLTHEEDGCMSFSVTPCPVVEGRFLVAEVFRDQDAFDAHQMRTHKSAWAKITEGIPREYKVTEDVA